ncbi:MULTISPECIES: N-acetyltransferase [unclassified Streptomyces]|uniref:GNAT family N-acetyltransferase n=1 Tax=unclassified Streptomyces TaxID=2593676 RepID=UPI00278C070B|nr:MULTISPECIES: GNAT family N-acetyltransferase [unclassified Streptomyces]
MTITITTIRVAENQWHALEDDEVVGRGHAAHRPDGRLFVSVDAWHDTAFTALAKTLLGDLPGPLHTVVDETDIELAAKWRQFGFTVGRSEWEYEIPTDPAVTGLGAARPPAGVTVVPAGQAAEDPLRALDRTVRAEVGAAAGWHTMPAEVRPLPPGGTVLDPAKYTVAAAPDGGYLGLLRLATATRRRRVGLLAVRTDARRRGIARALLADVLNTLHRSGTRTASAEVDESNTAATALFDGIGARRVNRALELVR